MTKDALIYLVANNIAYAHVREKESGKLFNVKISKMDCDIDYKVKTNIIMNQTRELSEKTLEHWEDEVWYFCDLLSMAEDNKCWDIKFSHEPNYDESYILVCPKHTRLKDGRWLLWCDNEAGYTTQVDKCGLYYEDWIKKDKDFEIIDESNYEDVKTELNKTLFYDGRRKDNGRYEGTSFAIKYKDMVSLFGYPVYKAFSL